MVGFTSALLAASTLISRVSSQSCASVDPAFPATFAEGYSGKVLINGLEQPRGLIFDNQGNILTTEQAGYGVRYIQITDNGGLDVCVASSKQLIADNSINHGIALTPDGTKLYVSSANNVWSWDYDGTTGTVSNRKEVIRGMTQSGFHLSRTLLIPKSNPDILLVQRGSQDNIDNEAGQIETARSQIRSFNRAAIDSASVEYSSGDVLAWGLRNTVGVGEDPTGGIWTVDNGMDNMLRDGVDIHNTNPCEELNYHGPANDTSTPYYGAHYGYPECHAVWDPTILPAPLDSQFQVGDPIVHGSPGGENTDARCSEERQRPKLCFPSHTAPLGVDFNGEGTKAWIAFHGSWNRSPPDGYRVSEIDFDPSTLEPVHPPNSTTAAKNIMYNADNAACPNECFRPVNLVYREGEDGAGRLFITSDSTGEVWVVAGV